MILQSKKDKIYHFLHENRITRSCLIYPVLNNSRRLIGGGSCLFNIGVAWLSVSGCGSSGTHVGVGGSNNRILHVGGGGGAFQGLLIDSGCSGTRVHVGIGGSNDRILHVGSSACSTDGLLVDGGGGGSSDGLLVDSRGGSRAHVSV